MKKLILPILTAISLAFYMTSCLSSEDPYIDPMQGGYDIYAVSYTQNVYAMEPAGVALRLGLLLKEAEIQSVDMEDVEVTIDGVADQSLQARFFGKGTGAATIELEDAATGTYKITYPTAYSNSSENVYKKRGVLRIITDNKHFNETDARWIIEPAAGGQSNPFYMIYSAYGYDYNYYLTADSYELICTGDSEWEVYADAVKINYEYNNNEISSNWDMAFMYSLGNTTSKTSYYEEFITGSLYMSGDARGETVFNDWYTYRYEISPASPLVYKRRAKTCSYPGLWSAYSGTETSRLNSGSKPVDTDMYPATYVTVTSTEGSASSCDPARTMEYNGLSKAY